ncbi:MAG: DUF2089 domain-containing protein [Caldilineaceae bacterium SB0664_bin_27]|uniref:DUF2089 domain-containing protein n=1 Tax=Caldilineaceae bacterium SB0664_bin_27 TaxID=2605260 RepID=A0A6B0YQZ6_9CHLR|nr:DUF2089 domain-containing protein [Caldilineaceae bacterium SB0664_bin_27]
MRKVLEECPSCGGAVEVTRVSCTFCDTEVTGRFAPCRFCRLPPETAQFLEVFVRNRGNVKEMERELGISYWIIRSRINDLITDLGFESEKQDEFASQRQEILERVSGGELTAAEAAELLGQLQ